MLSWLALGIGPGPGEPGKTWRAKHSKPGVEAPKKAIKCDMCAGISGGPACVRACPTGAAIRVAPETFLTVARLDHEGRCVIVSRSIIAVRGQANAAALHDGFLRHKRFRWLKIALALSVVAILGYVLIDVKPRPSGGSWYGYTLGTIAVLLILWLTALGLRKRAMTRGRWSLKVWTSAHVYLGLSLIVIGTLHTGFQFGWNVHTLAYALMMLVIASGVFGIWVYSIVPAKMSDNREQMTQTQMIDGLRAVDRQLHDAAQPLTQHKAALVQQSLEQNPFGGSIFARLSARQPRCATARTFDAIRERTGPRPDMVNDPLEKVDALLERKLAMLVQLRRHLRLKALLEIWLYVHVPATFALIAALTAHIVSVFFYW